MQISYRAIYHRSSLVRRLRYVTQLLHFVVQNPQNKEIIAIKLRDWSVERAIKLANYKYNTGAAHSHKQVRSTLWAKNYIILSEKLGFLSEISNVFHLTRIGRVAINIQNDNSNEYENLFCLTDNERLLFTYQLLHLDADILLTILNIIELDKNIDLKKLKAEFYMSFVNRLKLKISLSSEQHNINQLHDRLLKITEEWKKPEAYASYFLPPRLNWLLDLGLLDVNEGLKSNVYQLTESGQKLVNVLRIEDNSDISDVTDDWFNTQYFSDITPLIIFSTDLKLWQEVDDKTRKMACEKYLPIAFEKFRNSSVPKVSLKQTILFLCLRFGMELKLITNFNELIQWFEIPRVLDNYIYEVRISARENESYFIRTHV